MKRIPELDGLRGLAACMILLGHLPLGFWFGETGADLFFVLSGFLISSIVFEYRDRPRFLSTFFIRRAIRILPVYYLVLAAVFVGNQFLSVHSSPESYLPYLVFLQKLPYYWGGTPGSIGLDHSWILAVEVQFYLLWPLALGLVGSRRAGWLCAGFFLVPIFLRSQGLTRYTLLGHCDGLALGSLLAFARWRWRLSRQQQAGIALAGLSAVGAAAYILYWLRHSAAGDSAMTIVRSNLSIAVISLTYVALIGALVVFSGHRLLAVFRWRPLTWLGTISYGLYLYHWVIFEKLDLVIKFRMNQGDPWWLDALKVVASIAAAGLSWALLEKPLLRLKDRFDYRLPGEAAGDQDRPGGLSYAHGAMHSLSANLGNCGGLARPEPLPKMAGALPRIDERPA